MIKYALLFLTTCAFAITRLPEEFTITERPLSYPGSFELETELGPFAIAHKRLFSFSAAYDLEDCERNTIASSSARFFSWATLADVVDAEGNKIGKIEEEYFKILPWSEYKLYGADDQLKAIAKMDFWGTIFKVFPPDDPNHLFATIDRPLIRICSDFWTVKILDYQIFEQKWIDPRLLMMLAIYQTDKDNRDRWRKEFFNRLRIEHEDFQSN